MPMITGDHISNENEIIVSVSVILQNEGATAMGSTEDKKEEKHEKHEKREK